MPRPATGSIRVLERNGRTLYSMRFSANGVRHEQKVGYLDEGYTREKAETELAYVMERVRRGDWEQPKRSMSLGRSDSPTFHEFATEWYDLVAPDLSESGAADYYYSGRGEAPGEWVGSGTDALGSPGA